MSPRPLYTPDQIIEQIKVVMASFDPDAFKHNGRIQLYSGPRDAIKDALNSLRKDRNRARAFRQAGRRKSIMLTTR